jgi:hypothetical protein
MGLVETLGDEYALTDEGREFVEGVVEDWGPTDWAAGDGGRIRCLPGPTRRPSRPARSTPSSVRPRCPGTNGRVPSRVSTTLDNDEYHVVCFGNKPFDALIRYFDADVTPRPPEMKHATVTADGLTLDLHRVWFFGLYGGLQDRVPIFESQLQDLNQLID